MRRRRSLGRIRRNVLRMLGVPLPSDPVVAHRLGELKPDDVFLATYPRSGITWRRHLLADVVQQRMGEAATTGLAVDADSAIPNVDCSDPLDPEPPVGLPSRVLKTHSVYHPVIVRAIVVFRFPASSLCSFYHFHRRYDHMRHRASRGVDRFCLRYLDDWCEHVSSFLDAGAKGAFTGFWTSYEQMHVDTPGVLRGALDFLDMKANEAQIRRAVNNQAFENCRARESLGTQYREYFYRRGRVDSGSDELHPRTLAVINRRAMPIYERATALLSVAARRAAG